MSETLRGSLLAATALALVGSLVAAADLVEGYPLAAGQALRYSAAGLALLVVARGRLPRLQPRELLGLIALSATGLVLFNLFVIEGVRETDPATIGVIVGCVPVVLAFAGPLLDGRPVSWRVVAAAVVVAAGAAGSSGREAASLRPGCCSHSGHSPARRPSRCWPCRTWPGWGRSRCPPTPACSRCRCWRSGA